jgi:hypothetical protein
MMQQRTSSRFGLLLSLFVALGPLLSLRVVDSFLPSSCSHSLQSHKNRSFLQLSSSSTTAASSLEQKVAQLKLVLKKEYLSFFDPMERDYYSDKVTFDDPLTSLDGVDSYQKNVDMLAARTLLGKFLFRDASIVLHSVTGGETDGTDGISDITTRWTLRMTLQALPWQPTARFSGVSIYKVSTGGPKGVQIMKQTDYWDSINMLKGGTYAAVDKGEAVKDFLNQLKPENMQAIAAAPELPFTLLRRAKDYQVRLYPAYTAVMTEYERRDEGYTDMGVYTAGMEPLAPALMEVPDGDNASQVDKTMAWPLVYAAPGSDTPPTVTPRDDVSTALRASCRLVTVPAKTVAIGSFSDASVAPVVRKADRKLRAALSRDGIDIPAVTEGKLKFAQYDAVYSMGERRGEVWIELQDGGHPW